MKNRVNRYLIGLLATFSLAILPAAADLEVGASVQIHAKADFDAPLAPHGTWVAVGSYGRCWRPAHVAVGWRPYCSGEWVWTDCGWYWSSDEPWAWACYHYGWWVYDSEAGWVWVPHVEWAPAWVSWRVGGGYIGWAPLGPPGLIFASHPKAELFVFVGEGKFGGPVRPGAFIINNKTVFKQTTEMGGVKREARSFGGSGSQKVMVNHGPSVDHVQRATGKTFSPVSARDLTARSTARAQTKGAVADTRGSHARNSPDRAADRGPDRGDSPGKHESKSAMDGSDHGGRGSGGDNGGLSERGGRGSGGDSGAFGGRGGGGRSSGGGGRGRH